MLDVGFPAKIIRKKGVSNFPRFRRCMIRYDIVIYKNIVNTKKLLFWILYTQQGYLKLHLKSLLSAQYILLYTGCPKKVPLSFLRKGWGIFSKTAFEF